MFLGFSHGICNSELEEIRGHILVLVPDDGFRLGGYCDITPSAPLLLGPLQEGSDFSRNFIRMRFECKMPGIVEMHFRSWIVSRKGLRPGGQEERIVLPP